MPPRRRESVRRARPGGPASAAPARSREADATADSTPRTPDRALASFGGPPRGDTAHQKAGFGGGPAGVAGACGEETSPPLAPSPDACARRSSGCRSGSRDLTGSSIRPRSRCSRWPKCARRASPWHCLRAAAARCRSHGAPRTRRCSKPSTGKRAGVVPGGGGVNFTEPFGVPAEACHSTRQITK